MSMSKKSIFAALVAAFAMATVVSLPAKAESNFNPFEVENVEISGDHNDGHKENHSCGEDKKKKDKHSCGEGMKKKEGHSCGEGMKKKAKHSCGEGMKKKEGHSCGEGAAKKKKDRCGENRCSEGKKKMKKVVKDQ